jgi:flagellar basal-body rod protein FlgC
MSDRKRPMVSAISTALSGYNAAITRLDVSASNIANQSSTQSIDLNGETVASPYVPQQVVQSSNASGGVSTSTTPVSPASVRIYAPSIPGANAQGIVQMPNVDLVQQLVNTNIASYDARANLKLIKAQDEMMKQALNIIG